MTIEAMATSAQDMVRKVATKHGLQADDLFGAWPRRPEHEAARAEAIVKLCEAKLNDRPRYTIGEIACWFGVNRQRIDAYRRRSKSYQRRRQGNAENFRAKVDA